MEGSACRAHRFPAMFRPLMIRASGARWYALAEIMRLVLRAALAEAVEFVETRQWGGDRRRTAARRLWPFAQSIPSHGRLNGVRNSLGGPS